MPPRQNTDGPHHASVLVFRQYLTQVLTESVHRTADVEGRRHLRSSTTMTLVVPSVQRSTLGDRKGKKVKVKEADLYSAFIEVPYTQGAQVRITQCYLQTTPYLPLP